MYPGDPVSRPSMLSLARALMSAHHWVAAGEDAGAIASASTLDDATASTANGSRHLNLDALDIESSLQKKKPRVDAQFIAKKAGGL